MASFLIVKKSRNKWMAHKGRFESLSYEFQTLSYHSLIHVDSSDGWAESASADKSEV